MRGHQDLGFAVDVKDGITAAREESKDFKGVSIDSLRWRE